MLPLSHTIFHFIMERVFEDVYVIGRRIFVPFIFFNVATQAMDGYWDAKLMRNADVTAAYWVHSRPMVRSVRVRLRTLSFHGYARL